MGLYQYIREQKDRRDLVGDLARQLIAAPEHPLDAATRAFELVAAEFENCGQWTQQDADNRLISNAHFWDAFFADHRVLPLLTEAKMTTMQAGYRRHEVYDALKAKACQFVGYDAEVEENRTEARYDALIRAIADFLPPDQSDLYGDGLPEDVELDV